jgi:tetratricopeptide (TPR) repeat protein
VAEIFVSYTSKDRDWAFWIGQELEKLGHVPRIDAWENSGGDNIMAWMLARLQNANHVLCVISEDYFKGPFASAEFQAALWTAQKQRRNFLLPVRIADCPLHYLLDPLKRCDLFEMEEEDAREELAEFLKPAGKPSAPKEFPGHVASSAPLSNAPVAFPGPKELPPESPRKTISNIPINIPRHFLGRDDDLVEIEEAINSGDGRAAISALHGMRGVGKTTLAAAYAERHRSDYRATWWIRAETEPAMRADLFGLGVQLGWVAADFPEEAAVNAVLDRLRDEGDDILLVYDNAIGPNEVGKYLPRGGKAHIILTSNAPNWNRVAAPVEIEAWPTDVGADFLIASTGRVAERDAASALSEALGGLPLAHEQAAAYCERIGVGLAEYLRRFATTPASMLANPDDMSRDYGYTVSRAFSLAIEEASKRHPAAESLIAYAALLAPEPIPLYLFLEGREEFAEPFSLSIKDSGLDEAVAALRAFALVDRESIVDERDPSASTDCIRLHRLVRQVAATRRDAEARVQMRDELLEVVSEVYPHRVYNDPDAWLKARRVDAIAIALAEEANSEGAGLVGILNGLGAYRREALGAYAEARPYLERALAISEKALGPEHPDTARSLSNLGLLLQAQGDLAGARPYYERTLEIMEKTRGPEHPDTGGGHNNLGFLLRAQGDLAGARSHYERALAIGEKALGAEHPNTAASLNNLGFLLRAQGDLAGARPYYERALAINEKVLGPEHPYTATSLNNFGGLLQAQGDLAGAGPHFRRALAINEKVLGPEHPDTATSLSSLGYLLQAQGDLAGAGPYYKRALAINEKVLGPEHPNTAASLNNLGQLLQAQGDLAGALPCFERALAICERKLGLAHPTTLVIAKNLAALSDQMKRQDIKKTKKGWFDWLR